MNNSVKITTLIRKTLLTRIFRRRKTAFAKQRRLLRGDYNLF